MTPREQTEGGRQPTEEDLLLPFESRMLRGDYKEFFKIKRGNFFATVQAFPEIWRCFELLDEAWIRGFEDLQRIRDVKHIVPAILFMNAHAQFRIAWELGFSCCIGDAWNVLRSGIESVVHAHKIYREPQLVAVWSAKDDGPEEAKSFKKAFEENKRESLFPEKHGLDKLHHFWSQFSELGTHTTVASVSKRFVSQETTTDVNWRIEYFETDPKRLALFLYSLLQASTLMEKAFFDCFETRLKLDSELQKKRGEFERQRARLRDKIIQRFKLTPPTIWP